MSGLNVKVTQVDYHRNGISGMGFYVCAFTMQENDDEPVREMFGVVFPNDHETGYDIRTAVFDRRLIGEGVIAFFENSWRGDMFHPFLVDAIEQWKANR